MSSKFTTPLIFSTALALSALSFIACGEDSNPNVPGPVGNSSSSYVPTSAPAPVVGTANIEFSGVGVGTSLVTQVYFTGSIKLDFSDTNMVAENSTVRFTNLQFIVESASKTSTGSIKTGLSESGAIPADYFTTNSVTTINLDQIGLYADLTDGYTECGNFNLTISATATDMDDPTKQTVANQVIPFVRDEQNCRIPESSSSSAAIVAAPLVAATATISTKDNKCFVFATGTATSDATVGDICVTRVTKESFRLSSGTGLKFSYFENPKDSDRKNDWASDYLPENPTTADFFYKESALSETISNVLNELEVFVVGIAPTFDPQAGSAAGFYAFVFSDTSLPDGNGDVSISLTYLKAAQ